MPAGMQLRKLIEGETIWRKWHGTLDEKPQMSLAEIQAEFAMTHNVNPRTGKPVTRAGLCDSAWRWAIKHIDEAMPMLQRAWADQGEVISDADVKHVFVIHARHVFGHSQNSFDKYIKEHNLEKYV